MDWNFLIRNKSALFVTTDSRKVTPGCVFVALKGEHFDGNDFVDQARRDGAEYVICGENALTELQDLARAWRRSLSIPIIGITGTNGKTTTKELCAAVLGTKYNLFYTQGNLNNQIGVPLSLLSITRAHEMAIIEMGASHPGDIKELVDIAEPTCGLITNVGKAHLQGFGSFEGVMRTKAELYDFLRAHGGFCFRNTDNSYLAKMAGDLQTVPYTTGTMPEGTHLVGGYNAENVSAAICVGAHLSPITNHQSPMPKAYILGAMRELGEYSHLEHQNIVNMLLERKADIVLLVGEEYKATTAPYPIFENVEALAAYLQTTPLTGHHILLKGSRSNQLEKVIPLL